jgi:hypothetical protein
MVEFDPFSGKGLDTLEMVWSHALRSSTGARPRQHARLVGGCCGRSGFPSVDRKRVRRCRYLRAAVCSIAGGSRTSSISDSAPITAKGEDHETVDVGQHVGLILNGMGEQSRGSRRGLWLRY